MTEKHLVFGARGAVGREIVKQLEEKNSDVYAQYFRSTSSHENEIQIDLLDKSDTVKKSEGFAYVYLAVGFPYSSKSWKKSWPLAMQNIVKAAEVNGLRLIFLDNIYMYGHSPLPIPFDEETGQNPPSQKGLVRKEVAGLFMQKIEENKIQGLIARAPDFFGPKSYNSVLYPSFLQQMLKGKNPMTLSNMHQPHTFSYTPDIATTMIELASNEDCYGQIWHTPVLPAKTLEEYASQFNKELHTNLKLSRMPRAMMQLLKWFVPILKEVEEMNYQFEHPYHMNDEKFKKRFPSFPVTSWEKAVAEFVKSFTNG